MDIPANPGFYLLRDVPDEFEQCCTSQEPIIAWRITGDTVIPVTPIGPVDTPTAIISPSGPIIRSKALMYDNLKAWHKAEQGGKRDGS